MLEQRNTLWCTWLLLNSPDLDRFVFFSPFTVTYIVHHEKVGRTDYCSIMLQV